MAATYDAIQTSTLTSASATFNFTSIPQTYTDLVLVIKETTSSSSNEHGFRVNSDTGTNYSETGLQGNGTAASSFKSTNVNRIGMGGSMANNITIINFLDYANTTKNKLMLVANQNTGGGVGQIHRRAALWRNTSAISSIQLDTFGSAYGYLFRVGTMFTLYGIKAA